MSWGFESLFSHHIGLWWNGITSDFDSDISSSNLEGPAIYKKEIAMTEAWEDEYEEYTEDLEDNGRDDQTEDQIDWSEVERSLKRSQDANGHQH